MDAKIVQVALNGLENILRLGEQDAGRAEGAANPYAVMVEECYGAYLYSLIFIICPAYDVQLPGGLTPMVS